MEKATLTGITDLDKKIMLEMNDGALVNFCYTNRKTKEICDSNSFWKQKLLQKGIDLEGKSQNESYLEYYIRSVYSILYRLLFKQRNFFNIKKLTKEATNFFKNANIGEYNGEPLNKNLIESTGLTTSTTLHSLLTLLVVFNMDSKKYSVSEEMEKYMPQTIENFKNQGIDPHSFKINELPALFVLMTESGSDTFNSSLQKLLFLYLVSREQEIIREIKRERIKMSFNP